MPDKLKALRLMDKDKVQIKFPNSSPMGIFGEPNSDVQIIENGMTVSFSPQEVVDILFTYATTHTSNLLQQGPMTRPEDHAEIKKI
jgi:hypothetical protein